MDQRWTFHIFSGAKSKLPLKNTAEREAESGGGWRGAGGGVRWSGRAAAAEACGPRSVSAARSPPWLEDRLLCGPHPACSGSGTLLLLLPGGREGAGEWPAPSPTHPPPAQIRQRVCEGRRRGRTGTVCPSHLSLLSLPPARPNTTMGLGHGEL